MLSWDKKWDTVLDASDPPFWKWFTGGRLNASYNCIDRHLADKANKAAIIWVPEPEAAEPVAITYRELYHRVNEFAALLRDFAGLKAGDRVTVHMPMVAELPIVMLACARLGVVHSEVFGGFSGNAVRDQDRRLRQPGPDHDRRVLPQRHAGGPQGQGRRGAGRGGQAGPGGRQGPGLAASRGRVRLPDADGDRPRLLRGRGAHPVRRPDRGAGLDAVRGAAVPDVHQRHHRPPQGRAAQHRRVPVLRDRDVQVLPGHPPRGHVLVHGRHRVDHRALLHRATARCPSAPPPSSTRARPTTRTRAGRGGSPSGSG